MRIEEPILLQMTKGKNVKRVTFDICNIFLSISLEQREWTPCSLLNVTNNLDTENFCCPVQDVCLVILFC